MNRDSVSGTFTVAAILCVACSVLVSAAAVGLRPFQKANKSRFEKKNILAAAGISTKGADVVKAFENIETLVINLDRGEVISDEEGIDSEAYDQKAAARDPVLSVEIPAELDIAGIKRREKYSRVYLVKDGDKIEKVILPIYGKGLWSTLYGFIALGGDLNTVVGLTFYEHKETPGLGGEVDNPKWKAKWPGKQIYDSAGEIQVEVVKGMVVEDSPVAKYQVDGLSGATITSRGVSNLVRYWLDKGEDAHGFGPYLKNLGSELRNNG